MKLQWNLLLFSHSVVSNYLQSYGLQHTRLPCPSPSPRYCSNPCPLISWCHLTISSSVTSFSSFPQSFPVSGSFPVRWLFASLGQSIRASVSSSVLPIKIQVWFPLWVTGLISLLSKGLSRVLPSTTVGKNHFFSTQPSLWYNSHIHTWLLEKTQLWLSWPFLAKWCLLLKTLSRFVIAFVPRNKCLLILWLQSPSAVILKPKKIVCHCFHCLPSDLSWSDGIECHDLCFLNVEFQARFFTLLFPLHQEAL